MMVMFVRVGAVAFGDRLDQGILGMYCNNSDCRLAPRRDLFHISGSKEDTNYSECSNSGCTAGYTLIFLHNPYRFHLPCESPNLLAVFLTVGTVPALILGNPRQGSFAGNAYRCPRW